jgi:hypothetical protein
MSWQLYLFEGGGKRMKKELKVVYDSPLDRELDDRIEDALKSLGWRRYASGVNFLTNERDLAFDKEVEE